MQERPKDRLITYIIKMKRANPAKWICPY